jgi:hypothetical protein
MGELHYWIIFRVYLENKNEPERKMTKMIPVRKTKLSIMAMHR